MKNIYDLTQTSKNLLAKDKEMLKNKKSYLEQYDKNLREATELEAEKNLESAMSAARFSKASTYARSRDRINSLREEIQYNENSSVIGMTEMVTQVVKKSLLLDEAEYAKLNPNYEETIRETVYGLLKEADINEVINNKDTLAIMEYVARKTPSVREGKTLTEDELANYIASNKPADIDGSINNLSRNISSRVAQLMEKEQKKVDEIEADVKKAKEPKDKKDKKDEMDAEKILSMIDNGELSEEEFENLLKENKISKKTYDSVVEAMKAEVEAPEMEEEMPEEAPVEEMPAEEETQPEEMPEEAPEMEKEMPAEDPDMAAPATSGNPKKQIQLLPDGTISVNIFEELENLPDFECLTEEDFEYVTYDEFLLEAWTADKELAKQTGDISGWKTFIAWFIAGIPGILIAHLLGWNKSRNDDKYKEVLAEIKHDTEGNRLLKEIKEAVDAKDKKRLRELKRVFKIYLQRLNAYKRLKNLDASRGDDKREYALTEFTLVRETPRCGLIESLTVNEAQNMLARGEEYNFDTCLANALTYVTITETLSEMGLITVGDTEYANIISAAGGNLNEGLELAKIGAGIVSVGKKIGKGVKRVGDFLKKSKHFINGAVVASGVTAAGINKLRKESSVSPEPSLTESVQVPYATNKAEPESLAERIRRKRLEQEQNNTLHD